MNEGRGGGGGGGGGGGCTGLRKEDRIPGRLGDGFNRVERDDASDVELLLFLSLRLLLVLVLVRAAFELIAYKEDQSGLDAAVVVVVVVVSPGTGSGGNSNNDDEDDPMLGNMLGTVEDEPWDVNRRPGLLVDVVVVAVAETVLAAAVVLRLSIVVDRVVPPLGRTRDTADERVVVVLVGDGHPKKVSQSLGCGIVSVMLVVVVVVVVVVVLGLGLAAGTVCGSTSS